MYPKVLKSLESLWTHFNYDLEKFSVSNKRFDFPIYQFKLVYSIDNKLQF